MEINMKQKGLKYPKIR